MPPSGANSKLALCHQLTRRPGIFCPPRSVERKDVAGSDFLDAAAGQFQDETAGLVEADKATDLVFAALADVNVFAKPAGTGKPIAEDGGKAVAAIPLRDARAHRRRKPREQLLRRDFGAVRMQIGGRE